MVADRRVAATVFVSFLTAVSSLGLYTYLSPVVQAGNEATDVISYFWFWGGGGVIGSFAVGWLVDKTGKPAHLLAGILIILTFALLSIPSSLQLGLVGFLPFFVWGAMGWSSLVPQQHALLALRPEHGAVVVALNSSCNYLGSAAGAVCGGLLIASGVAQAMLPYYASAAALAALLFHLSIQVVTRKSRPPASLSAASPGEC